MTGGNFVCIAARAPSADGEDESDEQSGTQ